jgi:hypothetical protein
VTRVFVRLRYARFASVLAHLRRDRLTTGSASARASWRRRSAAPGGPDAFFTVGLLRLHAIG